MTPPSRWWPRLQAWAGGFSWLVCPSCGSGFGEQEPTDAAHFGAKVSQGGDPIPLCRWCTAAGIGCLDHVAVGSTHHGCEFVPQDSIWPAQDGDQYDPPTVVTEPVPREDGWWIRSPYATHFRGANHTAADAVAINKILNPQQPEQEPDHRVGRRREERLARHAEAAAAARVRHEDLLAGTASDHGRELLAEHGPHDTGDTLVCQVCAPRYAVDDLTRERIDYLPDWPCPVWALGFHLQVRDEA